MRPSLQEDEKLGPSKPKRRQRFTRLSLGPQEFIQQGLSRFDPHDPYFFAVALSWRKFVLLFILAELAINLVFASLYSLEPGAIANQGTSGFLGAFFFSLETLATVGYGEMYPATTYAHVISSFEIVTGVVFTAIFTGLMFVRFSKPRARVLYADHAVVTSHNGKPTLMLRIGNARRSILHDTSLSLYVLTRERSDEGQMHAVIAELPLVRPRLPGFVILHTIMHVLDQDSPIRDLTSETDDLAEIRFFLSIQGRDPTLGQQVADLHTFDGDNIRFGMRYVDAVQTIDRKVMADYSQLSTIVEAPDDSDPARKNIPC